ncbi:hypothetical protein F511_06181 [Dorcoceras hygrometricum]|uniref:PAR1 protein n=1 Tax=Dorcoceras hygrometricum TaxID=472368 RepID=A0A2Z7CQE2_9LAMI|nr:hypothetical protein F511_06181 [Dorcoceras hygrometricum]
MASQRFPKASIIFVIVSAFFVQDILGNVECENLEKDACSFAVSSSGKRCVLEKSGGDVFMCHTSDIEAENYRNRIETDECIKSCGLDRNVLGISSDSLLDSHFALKLCSDGCYLKCPNVVDLHFNLAAGEGIYLPKLCKEQGANARREMVEIKSSGLVAPGPDSSLPWNPTSHNFLSASAPALSPF